MISLSVKAAQAGFLDKPAVQRAMDRKANRAMNHFGGYCRKVARSSIRKRKAASRPGQPPSSHVGWLKGKSGGGGVPGILYAYDEARKTLVIGPTLMNRVSFTKDGRPVKGTVPQVLEEGGEIYVLEVYRYGRWRRADLRSRRRLAGLPTRFRRATIRPRPYMIRAFEKTKEKLPTFFQR